MLSSHWPAGGLFLWTLCAVAQTVSNEEILFATLYAETSTTTESYIDQFIKRKWPVVDRSSTSHPPPLNLEPNWVQADPQEVIVSSAFNVASGPDFTETSIGPLEDEDHYKDNTTEFVPEIVQPTKANLATDRIDFESDVIEPFVTTTSTMTTPSKSLIRENNLPEKESNYLLGIIGVHDEPDEEENKPMNNTEFLITQQNPTQNLSASIRVTGPGLDHPITLTPQTSTKESSRSSISYTKLSSTIAPDLVGEKKSPLLNFFNQLSIKVSDLLFPNGKNATNASNESVNMETWKIDDNVQQNETDVVDQTTQRGRFSGIPKTSKTSTHMPLSFLTYLTSPGTELITNNDEKNFDVTDLTTLMEETTMVTSEIITETSTTSSPLISLEYVSSTAKVDEVTPPFTTVASISKSTSTTSSPMVTKSPTSVSNSSTDSRNFLEFLAKLDISTPLTAPKPTSLPRQKIRTIPPSKLPRLDAVNETKVSHWHDWSLYWVTSTEPQPRNNAYDRRKLPRIDDEEGLGYGSSAFKRGLTSCPTICPDEFQPVCGSDKVIYKNDCQMRLINCQNGNKEIDSVDLDQCTFPNGSQCKHQCDRVKDLVCGTDGLTYLNKCFLQVQFCEQGIGFAHYGSCLNDTTDGSECPELCSKQDRDGPICGSDGNVYKSTCEMRKATCGQGVVPVARRHCQTTEHCDSECWKISRLTCGSDGKLYNNGCQMHRKNCGRHVFEVPVPYCLNKLYRTDCPSDCSDEDTNQVCGSDGNIYRNECEMKKQTCGFPLTRYDLIRVVDFEKCSARADTCSKMVCPYEKEEVCGTDGVTYANKCHLSRVTCTSGVQLAHAGQCVKEMKLKEPCPQSCSLEDVGESRPVCGSDGNTYLSECDMKRRTCGQYVVVAPQTHCQTTQFCDPKLTCPTSPTKRADVCGSDGQFYTSECEMRKKNCGKHVYEVPITQCLSNFNFIFTGCGRMCPKEYDPVCGSDDKTYSNQCFMEIENCRARALGGTVKRKYYGKCGEPKQNSRNYLYKR